MSKKSLHYKLLGLICLLLAITISNMYFTDNVTHNNDLRKQNFIDLFVDE